MAQQLTPHEQHQHESALILLYVFIAAGLAGLIWLANTRYHIAGWQIAEICIYIGLALYLVWDVLHYYHSLPAKRAALWPPPGPEIEPVKERVQMQEAFNSDSILIGHETDGTPFMWSDLTRSWQTIVTGQSGSGKTTLLEGILQQDIARGVPIIFLDGKGEKKLLDKILPAVEAAGRMHQFRLIDPEHPEDSVSFNPFWAPHGNPDEHVAFVFESFKVDGGDADFFDQHQRAFLENIARVLYYSWKKFNFYDVLVAAYDENVLRRQMVVALHNAKTATHITRHQRLTLEMSIHYLVKSLADREAISKIQGLINHLMTFMSDSLAMITGPYDNLLTVEEVLDRNLILYVSLNVNVNEKAVTALGRIILQNLQLTLGRRYAETGYGVQHPFVSVLMDEFAPFAYQNFSTILQTARGANVAFLFALQNYVQLEPAGFGLKDSLSTGPNNTFMLRMRDDETTTQFRREAGEVRQERMSVSVEKGGFLDPAYRERGTASKQEVYDMLLRDEQLKRLPSGQMQVLMSDPTKGLKNLHVHVREPLEHYFMGEIANLYPLMETPMWMSDGLHLRFPRLELEEKRTDNYRRGKGKSSRRAS